MEEIIVIEELRANKPKSPTPEASTAVTVVTEKAPEAKEEEVEPEKSGTSESESEEEAEYHAQLPASTDSTHLIKEEPEEEQEEEAVLNQEATPPAEAEPQPVSVSVKEEEPPALAEDEVSGDEVLVTPDEAPNGHADDPEAPPSPCAAAEEQEEEPCVVNGDSSHVEMEHVPQVICCSEVIGRKPMKSQRWLTTPSSSSPSSSLHSCPPAFPVHRRTVTSFPVFYSHKMAASFVSSY